MGDRGGCGACVQPARLAAGADQAARPRRSVSERSARIASWLWGLGCFVGEHQEGGSKRGWNLVLSACSVRNRSIWPPEVDSWEAFEQPAILRSVRRPGTGEQAPDRETWPPSCLDARRAEERPANDLGSA